MVEQTTSAAATFEEFFLKTNRDLTGALWLVTHNAHEAEEIAQDAYLKLWERWSAVGSMDDPRATFTAPPGTSGAAEGEGPRSLCGGWFTPSQRTTSRRGRVSGRGHPRALRAHTSATSCTRAR